MKKNKNLQQLVPEIRFFSKISEFNSPKLIRFSEFNSPKSIKFGELKNMFYLCA
jgi:hypothetical protein